MFRSFVGFVFEFIGAIIMAFGMIIVIVGIGAIIMSMHPGEPDFEHGDIVMAEETSTVFMVEEIYSIATIKDGQDLATVAKHGLTPYPYNAKTDYIVPLENFKGRLKLIDNIDKDKKQFSVDSQRKKIYAGDVVFYEKTGLFYKVITQEINGRNKLYIIPTDKNKNYAGGILLEEVQASVLKVSNDGR